MSGPAIEVVGVTKTFGVGPNAYQALRGVDLSVNPGEFMMLSGPSGSGKTTLLSILGCTLTATTGTLRLLGRNVENNDDAALSKLRLRHIGFVFQAHNLLPALTVIDNVILPLRLRGFTSSAAREEASRLLASVSLSDKLDSQPADLSGGQRQRVAVARALAGAPPIILADEPTAALDAANGLAVTEMMHRLAKERGHTVVVVTHDSRIFHLADRIVQIEDGRIAGEPS